MDDRASFDTTVSSLYQTVLDPQHWDVAIGNVARYFASPNAALFSYDFRSNQAYDLRFCGYDPAVSERYGSYYCKLDPGRSTAMVARVGEWVADEPLLDVRSPHDQEYVQDFALPSGMGWVGGVKVAGDATACTWLSMHRRPGAERFGDAALRQYRELEPHLRRVIQMQARLDALAVSSALALACLDRLHAGVIVVDKARHAKLVNAHAVRLLGRELSVAHQKLHCGAPALDEQLGRLIELACARPGKGGAMRVEGHDGMAPLLLSILPIPQHHELAALLPEPLALIVIGDPAAETAPIDVLRALFSLSANEAALMAALARGASVSEWARQRNVSLATVRTQLRSLFDKTGTDSQARLVGLAKTVPPIG